ncbi:MAG: hypothetical protein RR320_00925 [Oscillospiraceae bacterium]
MLCPSCEVDMLILSARYELMSAQPPAGALVQTLVCPRCGKSAEIRHPLRFSGAQATPQG